MSKKRMAKWAIVVCGAMAWAGVAFADGNVLWWKGADWGQFNNPANWDVGAVGGGALAARRNRGARTGRCGRDADRPRRVPRAGRESLVRFGGRLSA